MKLSIFEFLDGHVSSGVCSVVIGFLSGVGTNANLQIESDTIMVYISLYGMPWRLSFDLDPHMLISRMKDKSVLNIVSYNLDPILI